SSSQAICTCWPVLAWPKPYSRANFKRIFRLRTNARPAATLGSVVFSLPLPRCRKSSTANLVIGPGYLPTTVRVAIRTLNGTVVLCDWNAITPFAQSCICSIGQYAVLYWSVFFHYKLRFSQSALHLFIDLARQVRV